uniref:Uncharacterized protein n=1 Tax=Anguilla anguilla TaxID=7936 RepID=A0A0E9XJ78_ANGAN
MKMATQLILKNKKQKKKKTNVKYFYSCGIVTLCLICSFGYTEPRHGL